MFRLSEDETIMLHDILYCRQQEMEELTLLKKSFNYWERILLKLVSKIKMDQLPYIMLSDIIILILSRSLSSGELVSVT